MVVIVQQRQQWIVVAMRDKQREHNTLVERRHTHEMRESNCVQWPMFSHNARPITKLSFKIHGVYVKCDDKILHSHKTI